MHEKACDRDGQSGSSGATDVSGKAEAAVRSAETNKWTGQDGIHVDFVTPIGMNTEISATGAHNLISVTFTFSNDIVSISPLAYPRMSFVNERLRLVNIYYSTVDS